MLPHSLEKPQNTHILHRVKQITNMFFLYFVRNKSNTRNYRKKNNGIKKCSLTTKYVNYYLKKQINTKLCKSKGLKQK